LVLRDTGLLDAGVLALGLERGWVDRQTIAAFAVEKMSAGDERPEVVELAACEQLETDAIVDLLRRWAVHDAQPSITSEQAVRRWLFAFLKGVAQSDDGSEETLDRLEEIYGQLGYPEEMRECSRYYVPPEDRNRGLRIGDTTASPLDAMNKLIATLSREFGVAVS
jgi:hypothetical protein